MGWPSLDSIPILWWWVSVNVFSGSLIFMELEAEKEGGGNFGLASAMKTLKKISSTTAKFGSSFH